MHHELLISGIQIGIVAAGATHRRLGVIWNRQPRRSTEEFQRADVRLNPGFQLLVPRGFRRGARRLVDALRAGEGDDRAVVMIWRR